MTGGRAGERGYFLGRPLPLFAGGNTNAEAAKSASFSVTTGPPACDRVEDRLEGGGSLKEGCLETGGG